MIDHLKDMLETRPVNQALLGLDVGKKTIGLALSNPDQTIATPLETIKRTKFSKDMVLLGDIIQDYEVGGFVVGLPVNMDGTEGRRAQSIRDFCMEMEKTLDNHGDSSAALRNDKRGIWVALWDERLSTVSVEGSMDKYVEKRKIKANAKASGLIDKLAAQVILQGALDYIAH